LPKFAEGRAQKTLHRHTDIGDRGECLRHALCELF